MDEQTLQMASFAVLVIVALLALITAGLLIVASSAPESEDEPQELIKR